ncbi:XK-related protein 4-like [Lineus longissimus]|uniref:XK-related protein 4-like n=1 Tax=Lineus longissimus TaxID=88925 RepID=UPI00315C9A6F
MANFPKFPRTRRDKPLRTIRDDHFESIDATRGHDQIDGFPEKAHFGTFDVLVIIASIGSFFFDLGSDLWVAHVYFSDKEYWYFGMTVAFIMIPSLTMMVFSFRWYIMDYHQKKRDSPQNPCPVPCKVWFLRTVCLLFQVGPVLRYGETLYNGLKSRKTNLRNYYFQLMLYEDADSTLLRLFECFLEAAPQLVLQLYIMASQGTGTDTFRIIIQAGSCSMSLISLAWSLTSFHRALRFTRNDKKNLRRPAMVLLFMWRIFTIGTRVLAIALFASHFHYYVFVILGAHWLAMTIWLVFQKTNFCSHRFEEVLFDAICGVVYIFCFLNLKDGPTRYKYLAFYTVVYMENLGMIVSWFFFTDAAGKWYHYPCLMIVIAGFLAGILIMQIYYFSCHPSKGIKFCIGEEEATPVVINGQNSYHGSTESLPVSHASQNYASPPVNSTARNGVKNNTYTHSTSGSANGQDNVLSQGTLV